MEKIIFFGYVFYMLFELTFWNHWNVLYAFNISVNLDVGVPSLYTLNHYQKKNSWLTNWK